MPSFTYIARDAKTGSEVFNKLEATSVDIAIDTLLKRDLLVVSIEEQVAKQGRTAGGKVSLKDLVVFTRQLATMVDAGMAVLGSLKGLAKQTHNKVMRDTITDICVRIEGGESLSDSMARHPKVFNQLYLCMVTAGEKGGLLAEVLSRLATYLENTARLQRKIKSAMMYPTVVTVVAISITIFLLVKVVPVFQEIFDSFSGKLPGPTLFLIQISNIMQAWFIPIIFGIGASVYGWIYFIKTKPGREFWDTWRIKLPIFGNIAHCICLARFTRTFASLVHSGVPILSVMQTVSKVSGNMVMEKAINAATQDIQLGESISDSLAKHPVFPDMIIRMMTAGEQTGKIDDMMERIANYLDEEIETVLAGLTALIEPILIVFLGVVVGGIVICMFLPIFKLSDLVKGSR
jgi:type IV pilus assembly protein PilC